MDPFWRGEECHAKITEYVNIWYKWWYGWWYLYNIYIYIYSVDISVHDYWFMMSWWLINDNSWFMTPTICWCFNLWFSWPSCFLLPMSQLSRLHGVSWLLQRSPRWCCWNKTIETSVSLSIIPAYNNLFFHPYYMSQSSSPPVAASDCFECADMSYSQ